MTSHISTLRSAESFANVTTWLDHIRKHAPPDTGLITMIVGNKTDLACVTDTPH